MTQEQAIAYFNDRADELAAFYTGLDRGEILSEFQDEISAVLGPGCRMLDIGAGCGADAHYFAEKFGCAVMAVEPAARLLAQAKKLFRHDRISWVDDGLPHLSALEEYTPADFILLSAVWQYIPPAQRGDSLKTLNRLLRPGGRILISFPSAPSRAHQHDCAPDDIRALCAQAKVNWRCLHAECKKDLSGRTGQKGEELFFHLLLFEKESDRRG